MKLLKAGKMFLGEGHEVFLYSGEQNEAECTEHVPLFTTAEREEWFGVHDQNTTWGHVTWDPTSKPWLEHEDVRYALERVDPVANAQRPRERLHKAKRGLDIPFDPPSALLAAMLSRKAGEP